MKPQLKYQGCDDVLPGHDYPTPKAVVTDEY
jgi:hypothetical protein